VEGHFEDALIAARQAIRSCKETGQTTYEPHALHTLGVIQQSLSAGSTGRNAAAAADSFTESLKLAQAMGAPLFALRPAISLAELYRAGGRSGEAQEVLAPIYGHFSEKLDFPLLSRAGKLLAELQ